MVQNLVRAILVSAVNIIDSVIWIIEREWCYTSRNVGNIYRRSCRFIIVKNFVFVIVSVSEKLTRDCVIISAYDSVIVIAPSV